MRAALGFLLVLVAAGAQPSPSMRGRLRSIRSNCSTTAAADPALIRRGQERTHLLGNCNVRHTKPGGRPDAGGLPIETPFGTLHSTNIMPPSGNRDRALAWKRHSFDLSARRRGSGGEPSLSSVPVRPLHACFGGGNNRALYAFLMTRDAVHSETPANDLPVSARHLFGDRGLEPALPRKGPDELDPSLESAQWNRGAYLVEGLGHCGACHTPRNALGAEKKDEMFSGGMAEGWYAYAINSASPAPVPWTAEKLHFYLRNGWHEQHGISRARWPRRQDEAAVSDEDVRAIAVYVASVVGEPSAEARRRGETAMAAAAKRHWRSTARADERQPDLTER